MCNRGGFKRSAHVLRGFTLLELLLVCSLLAMIVGLAAPLIPRAFSGVRLMAAADSVAASLSEARTLALQTGQTYRVQITLQDRSLTVEPLSETASEEDDSLPKGTPLTLEEEMTFTGAPTAPAPPNAGNAAALASDSFAPPSQTVLFYADGTATAAQVVIENREHRRKLVIVRDLTGTASIKDPDAVAGGTP